MITLKKQTQTHWQKFRLNQPPFENVPPNTCFWPSPHWENARQHLVATGIDATPLLLLQAPHGAGKTAFLTQLSSADILPFHKICVVADRHTTEKTLAEAIVTHLGMTPLDPTVPEEACLSLLQSQLQHNEQNGLVIIDNADQLTLHTLTALLSAPEILTDKPALRWLLVGDADFLHRVTNAQSLVPHPLALTCIDLPPLNWEQTCEYINFRLRQSGQRRWARIFDKITLQHIFQLSEGIPARIDRLAKQWMMDLPQPQEHLFKLRIKGIPIVMLSVSIIAVLSFAAAQIWVFSNHSQIAKVKGWHHYSRHLAVQRPSEIT